MVQIDEEAWYKGAWRPAMAFLYMWICFADFFLFPMIHMAFLKLPGAWVPLTLANGGLVHGAFGVVLGVAGWSRGKEKEAIAQSIAKIEVAKAG